VVPSRARRDATGVRGDRKGWLFRAVDRRRRLTDRRLSETDVFRMIKRRAEAGGVRRARAAIRFARPASPPTCRTAARWEKAQQIACHESPRTTKLYDRSSDTLALDEIERITL
jgi:hypothetical protein